MMEFNCKSNKEDKVRFDYNFTNGDDLRIELISEEPLVYLSRDDSVKLYNFIKNKFKIGD